MSFKFILLVRTALDHHLTRLTASSRIPPQSFFFVSFLQHHAFHFSRQWDDISLAWSNDCITHYSCNFSYCWPEIVVISPMNDISVYQNVTKYRLRSVSTGIFCVIGISFNKITLYQQYRNCLPRDQFLWSHYPASYSTNTAEYFFKIRTFPRPSYGTSTSLSFSQQPVIGSHLHS